MCQTDFFELQIYVLCDKLNKKVLTTGYKMQNIHPTANPLVFDVGLTTQNNAPVFTQSARNEDVPLHRHSYIEFFYVFDGTGTQYLNDERKLLHRGDAYLLTPSDVHGFDKTQNGVFLRRDILIEKSYFKQVCDFFDDKLFDKILACELAKVFTLSSEQISTMETYAPSLFLSPDCAEYKLAAKALTTFLVNIIMLQQMQTHTDMPNWLNNLLTRLSTRDNFQSDIAELTADFAYNADYMRRLFKRYIGMTMTDYFNKQKMNYAYSMLQNGNQTVEEICEAVGIANMSYFHKLFKDTFHTTPKHVRARNANRNY